MAVGNSPAGYLFKFGLLGLGWAQSFTFVAQSTYEKKNLNIMEDWWWGLISAKLYPADGFLCIMIILPVMNYNINYNSNRIRYVKILGNRIPTIPQIAFWFKRCVNKKSLFKMFMLLNMIDIRSLSNGETTNTTSAGINTSIILDMVHTISILGSKL